jgi:hypothetical protein
VHGSTMALVVSTKAIQGRRSETWFFDGIGRPSHDENYGIAGERVWGDSDSLAAGERATIQQPRRLGEVRGGWASRGEPYCTASAKRRKI